MSDEENCIRAIAAALSQVSVRLQGDALSRDEAQVSTEEASEFVEMLESVVANAPTEERARLLLFDINGELLPTVVSLLRTPQLAVPQGGLSRLLIAALRCLLRTVTYHSADGAPQSYLSRLACDAVVEHGGVQALVSMMADGHTAEVLFAAGELLFALLVRSDGARRVVFDEQLVETLVIALAEAQSPQARCFIAAVLRELANTDAAPVLAVPNAVGHLTRSLSMDEAADVRALCAETIDVLFKAEPAAWREFQAIKPLCAAITGRLERERSAEVLEATLKLLETLFVCDASQGDSNASFTEYFLAAFGDRLIVSSMAAGRRIASLAARALRLLLQLAPHYRFVGYGLCQHFPSLTTIMRALVQSASSSPGPEGDGDAVAQQVLGVELAIAFAMILGQDPRSRELVRGQLASTPQWRSELRAALLNNLNAAALEYFVGIAVVDATGTLLNDPRTVKWEPAGTRPLRASVEGLLPAQEVRWNGKQDLLPAPASIRDVDAMQAARLTFILLGFVAHRALGDEAVASPTAQLHQSATSPHADAAAQPSPHHASRQGGSPSRWLGPQPVHYTKSAMLREAQTHPLQMAAERRAEQSMPDALPRAASYYEHGAHRPAAHPAASPSRGHASPSHARHTDPALANPVFQKFDGALKLATRFAQFYNTVGDPKPVIYETDGSFARRQPKNASWFAAPTPHARSWTVEQLKEGDLFYFAIPYVGITAGSLEQVRQRAVRHTRYIKNCFTITPQAARARRWFLYDMLNNIMPGILDAIDRFITLCRTHGDENVTFPVVMFREHEAGADDGTLNSGNLVEVLEQVTFYFRAVAPHNVDEAGAAPAGPAGAQQLTSQYLQDVEAKIRALANAQYSGKETSMFNTDNLSDSDSDSDDFIRNAVPGGTRTRVNPRSTVGFNDSDDDD